MPLRWPTQPCVLFPPNIYSLRWNSNMLHWFLLDARSRRAQCWIDRRVYSAHRHTIRNEPVSVWLYSYFLGAHELFDHRLIFHSLWKLIDALLELKAGCRRRTHGRANWHGAGTYLFEYRSILYLQCQFIHLQRSIAISLITAIAAKRVSSILHTPPLHLLSFASVHLFLAGLSKLVGQGWKA